MDKSTSPTFQDVFPMVARGVDNYRKNAMRATLMAVVVLVSYATARIAAQARVDDGDLFGAFFIDFVGLTVATMLALPWFRHVLLVERESDDQASPFDGLEWSSMFVGTLFFWGGVLLGIRYLVGIPSLFMLVWYGLFGYAIAAGEKPGLKALGTSVRLGQGRRGVVGALAFVLAMLNLLAALPLGLGVNAATGAATVVLLAVTTNVSMGAGAHLFDWLVTSEGN